MTRITRKNDMVYSGFMTRRLRFVAALLVLLTSAHIAFAQETNSALAQAKRAFNQGQFDQAIDAALEAKKTAAMAPSAGIILGRAYVERFAAKLDNSDLANAHTALAAVDPVPLSTSDRRDLTIGLGLTVYFEGRPGAAAELLEVAMLGPNDSSADAAARERLFDWWATALDRAAQLAPDASRATYYARIVKRSEAELAHDPGSTAAGFWLAAGARGAAEYDRAWHAATAAWIRAKHASTTRQANDARADIDLLVTTAIIPERARALDPKAPQALIAAMKAEWEQIKSSW